MMRPWASSSLILLSLSTIGPFFLTAWFYLSAETVAFVIVCVVIRLYAKAPKMRMQSHYILAIPKEQSTDLQSLWRVI